MEKSVKALGDAMLTAEQSWRAAEHILSVTFPLVQEPKLLLHALEHAERAARSTISTLLKLEYVLQHIKLTRNALQNKALFFSTCAPRHGIHADDAALLQELLELGQRHRASGVEFSQQGKAIILDDDLGTITITAPHLHRALQALRRLQLQARRSLQGMLRKEEQ